MSFTIPAEDETWWREVADRGLASFQLAALDDEDGEEIIATLASLFTFLDARDARRLDGGYFFDGDGVGWTTAGYSLDFSAAPPAADVRVLAGSPLLVTAWGVVFVLREDMTITPGGAGVVTAQVVAQWAGYDGNVPLQLVDRWYVDNTLAEPEAVLSWSDDTTPADRATTTAAMLSGDALIVGVNPLGGLASSGREGSDGPLDLLARSRGVVRIEGETDLGLALRARALARRVTPTNIKAICDEILALVGSSCEVVAWYNAATGGAVSYTFNDETLGAFDVSPFGRRHRFMVLVRDWPYSEVAGGWAFGEPDGGAFGVAPFGATTDDHAEILAALEVAVDEARAFGYDGEVAIVASGWVTTPGLTV